MTKLTIGSSPCYQAFARCRTTRFAVKLAPNANRKRGPKLLAAAAPIKCKPGTDDSKRLERIGVSARLRMLDRIDSSINPKRDTATL